MQNLKFCNFFSVFIIICFVFGGCATKKLIDESKRTEMYVMVYDYENKGIQNAVVSIDGEEVGRTDIYGRYLLLLEEGENYRIQIKKNEYEAIEREFLYDPMHVLYFQIGNAAQLLGLAEDAMDENGYEEALGFLERSTTLDGMRIDAMYLKAIAYYKLGRDTEALYLLETLIPLVKNTHTIEALKMQIEALGEK